jgi:hypothetical protein
MAELNQPLIVDEVWLKHHQVLLGIVMESTTLIDLVPNVAI